MTRKELLEKCGGEGGVWKASAQITVVENDEGKGDHDRNGVQITVNTSKGKAVLWVMNHHTDILGGIWTRNPGIEDTPMCMEAAQILVTFFGLDIPELVVPTVEKMVEVAPKAKEQEPIVTTKEAELGGMVIAYEKILINREVTISR